ncbi:MAG: hypothetical protein JWL70_2483 [Acidimicrobiia bacterium]|nr:hypothetical protein [Acidimicrobiia bacterium]
MTRKERVLVDDYHVEDENEETSLLSLLRSYAQAVDDPPSLYLDLAKASFALRDLDAELADLTADSSWSMAAASNGIRSTLMPRVAAFDLGQGITMELEFLRDRLAGEVSDGELRAVSWHTADSGGQAAVVEGTYFEVANSPSGPFYLELDLGHRRVATDWLLHR